MTIVSLSVRYKSATVEEFIEKHAADVSGHGIFVKTDREFALGTLLQLDVRIADKQTLIAGVGRVVWRREAPAGTEKPVGVGVQFLRVDKSSRAMIDRLVAAKPDAGKRYRAEAEMAGPPPEAPPSVPAPVANARPAGAAPPTGVRPRPGWHKTTLVGVQAAITPLATPAPPPAAPSLPVPVPPPRRPTGHHSVIPAPPSTLPSKALVDSFHEKEDLTLIGDLPEMPEERKTTLVGVGGVPILAPRLPPPVAPPRLGGLSRKPAPVATLAASPAGPAAPVATESAPLVNESDIEVASLLPPDTVDDDEPEEETRMQSVDDLLGPAQRGRVISIPSAVATAPMLPMDPSPMIPIETVLPAPVETSPMFPVDSEPPPPVEPAPPPAAPAPRVPLPLVLPPRELFVPPLPPNATPGALMAQTGPRAGVLARNGSASGRDKAIAAVGAGLFVCALVAFVAAHPWTSSDAIDTSAPKATAAASAASHTATEWTATRRTATTATAAAPSEVTAASASAVATQAPVVAPPAPPPPAPQAQASQAQAPQAPTPQAPTPQAAQPSPAAATPPVAAPAPASPSPTPRPRAASTPAPSPSPPPATPSPPPPAPVATATPPRTAAPKPAPTQTHPTKSSVDDGF